MPVEDAPWPDDVRMVEDTERESPAAAATGTTSRGPSVTTPDPDLEPHRGAVEEVTAQQEPTPEPLPTFDPKVRDEFQGLLYLGKLQTYFFWLGHRFIIRTLTTDELLEVSLLHKPYLNTLGDAKAYQAALVAACVVSVDDKPLPSPISVEPSDTALRNRFDYVKKNWYPSVLDKVYEQYLLLETTVDEVMSAMGEASG